MICPSCNNKVSKNSRFCPKCGQALNNTALGNEMSSGKKQVLEIILVFFIVLLVERIYTGMTTFRFAYMYSANSMYTNLMSILHISLRFIALLVGIGVSYVAIEKRKLNFARVVIMAVIICLAWTYLLEIFGSLVFRRAEPMTRVYLYRYSNYLFSIVSAVLASLQINGKLIKKFKME